jgi:transcriptional regulator with XRE-family HTH domain
MTLSEHVRQLLKDRDWSQAQLAQASGLDPSVLSRILAGERSWRKEHIACVAAALSMSPEELAKDTDTPVDDGGELDAEFVATLTKAHGALVGENARITEELAGAKLKLKQLGDEQQKLTQQNADLQLALDREKRSRSTAESEKRATEVREGELARQVSALKTERSTLTVDLDATRRQVAIVQAAHAKATETANRNYVVAKDLEQKLSTAKGVATVTGLFGLAMVVGTALSDDAPAPRGGTRRRRA